MIALLDDVLCFSVFYVRQRSAQPHFERVFPAHPLMSAARRQIC